MQVYLSLILLLRLVESSYISFIADNADNVLEADVIETLSYATVTVGEPYVAQSKVITRVSASPQSSLTIPSHNKAVTSTNTPQSGIDSTIGTTVQSLSWLSNYESKLSQTFTIDSGSNLIATGSSTNPIATLETTGSGRDYIATGSGTNSIDTSETIGFAGDFTTSSGVASNVSSVSPTGKIATLLSQTGTTSTSTLFSSYSLVTGTKLNGTYLTSISVGTNNPLVTQIPSYSSQETEIITSSLTSNKTIYTVTISTNTATAANGTTSGIDSTQLSPTPLYPSNSTQISLHPTSSSTNSSSKVNPLRSSNSTQVLFSSLSSSTVSPLYPSNSTQSLHSQSSSSTESPFPSFSSSTLATVYLSSSSALETVQSSSPSSPASIYSSSSSTQTNTHTSSSSTSLSSIITTTKNPATTTIVNLFNAVSTNEPPTVFERAANPMSLADGVSNSGPIQTNKFYTNLIVGSQESAAFVYPYSLWKYTSSNNYGFAVQHTTVDQYTFGNYDSSGNSEYLINPLGIAQVVLSASDFDSSMTMEVDEMTFSSTRVLLSESNDSSNYLEIPLVQGMGFATGIYHGSLTAKIGSSIGFNTFVSESSSNLAQGVLKYRIKLLNDVTWLCYVIGPDDLTSSDFSLQVTSENEIEANTSVDGLIIQLAVAPSETDYEVYYDQAAGMYVTDFQVRGVSDGSSATYEFSYTTQGESASACTMIFALPHHESSLSDIMQNSYTGIQLLSTTKGLMKGYLTTALQFSASLNKQVSWLPWSSQLGTTPLEYSAEQLQLLAEVANTELQVSISESISGLNTYYLGKVIDKYSYILLTVSEIIQDEATTKSTLENIKAAFDILLQNEQLYPLVYDTKFNGLVSSGDWASTSTQYDFGNTYYNDHHFHYGYIIHAAAVIGYVDSKFGGTWATDNKDWVNSLVRDVANPSDKDQYFAQSRMFDWFNGHSWAAGLFENGNGKNEESSSEDYNFAYAMKLWGATIGDISMELRGDLMISIMKDSMNDYFYYQDDNTVEPEEIIGNKVSGILFDNIIDYTTYFGTNTEYIHGIHMLPITPVSSNIRSESFVSEEWQTKISPIIASLESGWAGILRLNQALFDPVDSYTFFSDSDFDSATYLDNGMSRTWALAFSGGLANSIA
ncbi:endo-1,3(4)-beta-glucanase DI49_4799 [Saccharomyces eubayanus]|uniref:endo-1,3(4)-beta-glucanase n=1 Tax=Saccharomyces eubayanus TaxID=1080349 RepID=UPI0006BF49F4|nr:hypothetical protein DI49_4799 [Saccharomyces eubayanus]KOG97216.1 hypothetical protein DI49_4799 [Saccharomyces eubayanus]